MPPGAVLSDLRSPGSVVRAVDAVVVRTCADNRKVEVYDMPPTGFVAMTHDTYAHFYVFVLGEK